jgi:hypothetical protein
MIPEITDNGQATQNTPEAPVSPAPAAAAPDEATVNEQALPAPEEQSSVGDANKTTSDSTKAQTEIPQGQPETKAPAAVEQEVDKSGANELLEKEFVEQAAVANFEVLAIDSNGAHEESRVGYTLRLVPVETPETNKFFKSAPPELHISVVSKDVAEKFKVGGKISLILLNED